MTEKKAMSPGEAPPLTDEPSFVRGLLVERAALLAETARLRTALRPFTFPKFDYPDIADEKILQLRLFNESPMWQKEFYPSIRMADVRRAREALRASQPGSGMSDRGREDWIEQYIRALPWSADTPDIHKTLVAGNLRRLYNVLCPEGEPPPIPPHTPRWRLDPWVRGP
jgi:hypothetical protein